MIRAIFLAITVVVLAACVPEQQTLIVTADPPSETITPAQTIETTDPVVQAQPIQEQVTKTEELPEQDTAPDTSSLQRVTVLPDPPKPKEDALDITQLQRVTVLPDPPKPAPIIPLNPYQFNGRPLSEIAARLGIADRQFSEQGMMIQHYYMAMCHLLLFVDETGTGPVILHIDVRAPNLGANLEEEACFTQIGARADAFQDRGR